ncbi:cysteine proteinase [Schizophyllum commune H4-8]|nr:cysteine proteinase [Schizophyllum commune H4-8]KAI5893187.1 cysteine proteinase [Schizophyllum commune H4-8]
MVFEGLMPWNWGSGSAAGAGERGVRRRRKGRGARRGSTASETGTSGTDTDSALEGYYPGLVNISGTYCYMNSTLQALASLSYLRPHLDLIAAKAEALDVATPVVDALRDLLTQLNTPHKRYTTLKPMNIIQVLGKATAGRPNSLLNSREHQDAQELFQIVSECVKDEIQAVDKERYRDRGLGGLAPVLPPELAKEIGKSVFDGLTANRRSCVVCGYTEAVMHFGFDSWQLALPMRSDGCFLEVLLEDYTRLEVLRDCVCRKCSLRATHARLQRELEELKASEKPKKKRLKEAQRQEALVRTALEEGRIEDDLPDVKLDRAISHASTKQAMVARPPPVLVLHMNRSMHFGYGGAAKNPMRIAFPEMLDLTPFTTSGSLSLSPTEQISTPASTGPSRGATPTPASYASARTLYRLAAAVCHYGAHSFGHFVCYRRIPLGRGPPQVRSLAVASTGEASRDASDYEWEGVPPAAPRTGRGWLRISDDAVTPCGIEDVLMEQRSVFMLYYERVVLPRPPYAAGAGGRNYSEETLKPKVVEAEAEKGEPVANGHAAVAADGEADGFVQVKEVKAKEELVPARPFVGPRIVRSVAAGRGRGRLAESLVVVPSEMKREASPVLTNGHAHPVKASPAVEDLSASAPALLNLTSSPSSSASTSPTTLPSPSEPTIVAPQPQLASPKPVDLKA